MDISTSLNVLINDPVDTAIRRCKEAGFSKLDFNYWDHQEYALGLSAAEEEAWARDIRAAADREGAQFTQMHGPVHGGAFDSMVLGLNVESFLEFAQRSIRTASILGVSWVVFHPSHLSLKAGELHKEVLAFNCDFYRRLIPVLEETGVGIALENLFDRTSGIGEKGDLDRSRRCYCAMPEQLTELIDRIGHPLFGACWDTGHGHKQGLRQGDSIRMLGSRLKALHIQDNNGIKDQHLLPYQGTIDWNEVAAALRDVGFGGDFTYEAHSPIRALPDELRDEGLSYAAKLARYIVRNN